MAKLLQTDVLYALIFVLAYLTYYCKDVAAMSTVKPLHEWMLDPRSLYITPAGATTSASEKIVQPPVNNLREEVLGAVKYKEAMNFLGSADADGLISLCVETVLRDEKSVIVFCPTKKWCDRAAAIIAQVRDNI